VPFLEAALLFLVVFGAIVVAVRVNRDPNRPTRRELRQDAAAIEHHRQCIRALNRLYVFDEMTPIFPNQQVRADIGRLLDEPPKEIGP